MQKERTFKLNEIVKIFGIHRHFVIHLVEKRTIKPLQDAKGRGKVRIYSYVNVLQIGIFLYLIKFDLSYYKASAILRIVKRMFERGTLGGLFYVVVVGFVKEKFGRIEPMNYGYKPGDDRHIVPVLVDYYDGDSSELGPYGVYDDISPEEALDRTIQYILKANPNMSKDHFAQYFILDIRNIKDHIDSKISKL